MQTETLPAPADIPAPPSQNPTGGAQTFNQPLIDCINHLVNAMRSDFGNKFKTQFKTPDELKQYKSRLYRKMDGKALDDVVGAYEGFIEKSPEWPPTVPEMVLAVYDVEKANKKRQRELEELERRKALPAPTHDCNPLEMLAEAQAEPEPEKQELTQAERLQQHEATLGMHGANIARRYADDQHLCAFPGCRKAGAVSGSVNGGETWYCIDHFRS